MQIILYHSTYSNSRIFVPWVSSVALSIFSQVQLFYWGLFHSVGGWLGKLWATGKLERLLRMCTTPPSACMPRGSAFHWGHLMTLGFALQTGLALQGAMSKVVSYCIPHSTFCFQNRHLCNFLSRYHSCRALLPIMSITSVCNTGHIVLAWITWRTMSLWEM